jgi:hypothetical protein
MQSRPGRPGMSCARRHLAFAGAVRVAISVAETNARRHTLDKDVNSCGEGPTMRRVNPAYPSKPSQTSKIRL